MKKAIKTRLKIIEMLKGEHMIGSQIQQRLNTNNRPRHHISINEISQLCRTTPEIEKKDFINISVNSLRCRQVIWGLKE